MRKVYDLLKKVPLLAGITGLVVCMLGLHFLRSEEVISVNGLVLRAVLACTCAGFIASVSGEKMFINSNHRTGYAILRLMPILVVASFFGLLPVIRSLIHGNPVENWPVKLVIFLAEMLFVGLFEEFSFRALITDSLLYQFRDKKGIFVVIAIVSCGLFGVVHVIGSDIHSVVTFLEALMKTVSVGLSGFIFLVVYWKTHNIWACAIVHAINDALISLPGILYKTDTEFGSYVMDGTQNMNGVAVNVGLLAVAIYVLQSILLLIGILTMIKFIKGIDFEQIRREW